ncbi:MAG: ABC transporter permease [Metallosphaera yellowstonensis]|jgi:hypothetical protein
MKFPLYVAKRLITTPYLLFWAVIFVTLIDVMGAFLESREVPHIPEAEELYVSSWFGISIIMSYGSAFTSLAFMVSYQTGSLPHLFRYSKMTPSQYLSGVVLGSVILSVVLGTYMLFLVYALFSSSFNTTFLPKDLPLAYLTFLLSGVFFSTFSVFLGALSYKYSRKLSNFFTLIPFILAFIFGFSYLFANLGNLVYINPLSDVQVLAISSFLGGQAPTGLIVISPPQPGASDILLTGSLIVWIVIVTVISSILLRRLYLNPVEEGKLF